MKHSKSGARSLLYLAWLHGIVGSLAMVSILQVNPPGNACESYEVNPSCRIVCERQNDTVAAVFKDIIPCSELSASYRYRKESWFCNTDFNMDEYPESFPFFLETMESAAHFYYYGDPEAMKRIQACKGYHHSCHWHFPYIRDPISGLDFSQGMLSAIQQLRNPKKYVNEIYEGLNPDFQAEVQRLKQSDVFYMASNIFTHDNRSGVVNELMRYIDVDSWGEDHLNMNRSLLSDYSLGRRDVLKAGREKLGIMANYKFTLAFENAVAEDYVTEKVWGALAVGSVPVVLADRSIFNLIPSRYAIIFVQDFKTMEELASYLSMLLVDDALYAKHTAWRDQRWAPSFIDYLRKGEEVSRQDHHRDICEMYSTVDSGTERFPGPEQRVLKTSSGKTAGSTWRKPKFDDRRDNPIYLPPFVSTTDIKLPRPRHKTSLLRMPSIASITRTGRESMSELVATKSAFARVPLVFAFALIYSIIRLAMDIKRHHWHTT
jgi:hypothetical protein